MPSPALSNDMILLVRWSMTGRPAIAGNLLPGRFLPIRKQFPIRLSPARSCIGVQLWSIWSLAFRRRIVFAWIWQTRDSVIDRIPPISFMVSSSQ